MGADHPPAAPASRRLRVILAAILVPSFVVTIVAAVVLWPGRIPSGDTADPVPRYEAVVTRIVAEACPPAADGAAKPGRCGTVAVRLGEGPDAGREIDTELPAGPGSPRLRVGDDVIVTPLSDPETPDESVYTVADQQRGVSLLWLVAIFAMVIVAFGRWRGLASLVGLGASFAILLGFILPALIDGRSPLPVAITGAALIMFVVLYVTHGVTAQTSVAVLGTLCSLALTGALGLLAMAFTHLTGFGSEEAITVSLIHGQIDLHGLLLAGIIVGSLGVLDDVTVTQAATVTELAQANPSLTRRQLYLGGVRVGRAHIASTVNTIILVYAGASLPALLLLITGGRAVTEVLTSEFVAQEIVRGAVGTLGLIAAVPITTALAAIVTAARVKEFAPAGDSQTTTIGNEAIRS